MTKGECETAIRSLCHTWAQANGITTDTQPSVMGFLSWIRDNHPAYLRFRTTGSVEDAVERWFDDELKQNWQN